MLIGKKIMQNLAVAVLVAFCSSSALSQYKAPTNSAQVDAEICPTELQGLRSALGASGLAEVHWIQTLRGEHFEKIDSFKGISFSGAVTDVWQFCSTAACNGPQDRARLLAIPDEMDKLVKERRGRGEYDIAFHRFKGCIARAMAAQLNKPKRPYQ